ncbi:MAG: hypothetical protein JO141_31180 [Bradyrhizobium sp.]|nr:hypothetical protein [Bradyrhizobium sp.]
MRALSAHAGRDPLDIGYFRRAEPEDIWRAKPPLIFLRERPAGRRPQGGGRRNASHKQQPPNANQLTHRPLFGLTGVAVAIQAVRRLRIDGRS